jgi:hypothetical protein
VVKFVELRHCVNACSHQASVLGMYPLAPSSHMTIRWWFTRKTKWNKWGFSISYIMQTSEPCSSQHDRHSSRYSIVLNGHFECL